MGSATTVLHQCARKVEKSITKQAYVKKCTDVPEKQQTTKDDEAQGLSLPLSEYSAKRKHSDEIKSR